MIALSIAEIAEIVRGTLADIGPAEAAATNVTGSVEFDSRSLTPGGLFRNGLAGRPRGRS